jgi:hypothetical protein
MRRLTAWIVQTADGAAHVLSCNIIFSFVPLLLYQISGMVCQKTLCSADDVGNVLESVFFQNGNCSLGSDIVVPAYYLHQYILSMLSL